MKIYCVLKENKTINDLLLVIQSNYEFSDGEIDLDSVLQQSDDLSKIVIKDGWQDLELMIGYEIRLLQYAQDKICFIAKLRADNSSEETLQSIYNVSNIKIEIKYLS